MRSTGPTYRGSAASVAARHVLARCAVGPQSAAALKDDLAARCGSQDGVARGIHGASVKGWIARGPQGWTITDAGRAELQAVAA